MNRKGQTTLFIILGIVLVMIIVVAFLLFRPPSAQVAQTVTVIPGLEDDSYAFQEMVQECSDDALMDDVVALGSQSYLFDWGISYVDQNVPLFYADGDKQVPDLDLVESEMGEVLEQQIDSCLLKFVPSDADSVTVSDVSIDLILGGETNSYVSVAAEFEKDGSKSDMETEIESLVELDVTRYFVVIGKFVDDYIENEGFCSNCVVDYYEEYGFTFSTIPYQNGEYIFMKDDSFLVDGVPYEFRFAIEDIE